MARKAPSPVWNHPLFGADLLTLIRALVGNGRLPRRVWLLAFSLLAAAVVRAPFSALEWIYSSYRIRLLPGDPPPEPVFILGHWRSGTTHLFNIMSQDPRFAWPDPFATGMPWDFLLLGRLLKPLTRRMLPQNRYIDNVEVTPDSPQEDEIALAAMQDVSYYHGIYFPQRFRHHFDRGVFMDGVSGRERRQWISTFLHYNQKLLIQGGKQTLLVKNPVYTARVSDIVRVWPGARFVHIYRDPHAVLVSTRRFYRALLPTLALQPFDDTVADRLILDTYPRMMDNLYRDIKNFPENRFVELAFEDLERDPLGQLGILYADLGLPGFEDVAPAFESYLQSVTGYRKNPSKISEEDALMVAQHWGSLLKRWGYDAIPRTGT